MPRSIHPADLTSLLRYRCRAHRENDERTEGQDAARAQPGQDPAQEGRGQQPQGGTNKNVMSPLRTRSDFVLLLPLLERWNERNLLAVCMEASERRETHAVGKAKPLWKSGKRRYPRRSAPIRILAAEVFPLQLPLRSCLRRNVIPKRRSLFLAHSTLSYALAVHPLSRLPRFFFLDPVLSPLSARPSTFLPKSLEPSTRLFAVPRV